MDLGGMMGERDSGPLPRRALAVVLVGLLALAAACGVEVPEDVADDIRAEATTTTTDVPATTETPTSDDELEQALIDNGYTLAEAECGATNLRERLDDDEITSIVGADTIEDIPASTARAFAVALRPCVEDGAGPAEDPDAQPDRPGGGIGRMPDFGDDSVVDVSRSRFLSALIAAGVPDREARCIVGELYSELDQEDINTLFHAGDESELPDDLLDAFTDITRTCR